MKRRKMIPQRFFIAEGPDLSALASVVSGLPAGTGVIFRCYARPDRADWARHLRAIARRRRCPFLVAGDAALARDVGADGLHLPEFAVRRLRVRPPMLLAAAHSRMAVFRAVSAGADAVLLSPLHATESHPSARIMGPHRFSRIARTAARPVIALGGMTPARAAYAGKFGAHGAAGISMFRNG